MTANPLVSIIIVSFNTREMTCACIQSVLDEGKGVAQEIIVLDNCSSDGSADAIAGRFPDITLVRSPDNLGFGKGNNVAAEHATGEYILLLNPDTLILDRAVERLLEFARQKPQAKMWGGKTLFADGSLNPASCWAFMTPWSVACGALGLSSIFPQSSLFNREAYPGWNRDSEREVDLITGCFLLLKRSFWYELGAFDEKFYVYAEEADLCYRARKQGAIPTVTPTARIVHYGGASENVRSGKLIRLFSGKATFIRKHWSPPVASIGVFFMKLHAFLRMTLLGLSGTLRRNDRHKNAASEWHEVWVARKSWQNGYA